MKNQEYDRSKHHRKPRSKTAVDYVDNKKFYEEIVKFQEKCKQREFEGLELPRPNDYLGECIINICNRLGTDYRFKNYSFLEEMKGDAMISCTAALSKFDPEKSTSPFSYMTETAWWAFVARINNEEEENYIKHKNLGRMPSDLISEMGSEEEAHWDIISKYEEKLAKKKAKKIEKDLEKLKDKQTKEEANRELKKSILRDLGVDED